MCIHTIYIYTYLHTYSSVCVRACVCVLEITAWDGNDVLAFSNCGHQLQQNFTKIRLFCGRDLRCTVLCCSVLQCVEVYHQFYDGYKNIHVCIHICICIQVIFFICTYTRVCMNTNAVFITHTPLCEFENFSFMYV